MSIKAAAILGLSLVAAAFVYGGIYSASGTTATAYIVNRYTGSAAICGIGGCRALGPMPVATPQASFGRGEPRFGSPNDQPLPAAP